MSLAAGPLTGLFPTRGLTATTFLSRRRSRTPGRARMGPMLVTGLLGPMRIVSSFSSRSRNPWLGSASSNPVKTTERTSGSPLPAHPEVLKVHHPLRGGDNRRDDVVRHGDDLLLHPQCPCQGFCGQAQFDAPAEQIGAKDVHGSIFIPHDELLIHAQASAKSHG